MSSEKKIDFMWKSKIIKNCSSAGVASWWFGDAAIELGLRR